MAQFVKRASGWQARIYWREGNKRKTKSKAGFPTKKLAQMWVVENESQLNKGINIQKTIPFIDYYSKWVQTYKEPKVSAITLNRYKFTEKALRMFFKGINIKNITREHYQQFINWYGKEHAPHTVREVNRIVRACVRSAILDDYLVKDFTQGVTLVFNENKALKVDYLNLNEIKQLLQAALDGDNQHSYSSRYMIVTAIYTGMRLSEIQALTWNDIDWLHQTISVDKSWDMHTKSFKPTKNKPSVRTIKVNQSLLKVLGKLKARHISNMVFMTEFGTIPTSNAVNKVLRKLLANLNIHRKNFHFHSLRHSHVALLLANGVDIYAISKRLGHSNIRTTTETYAYLMDEYKQKTDNQISQVLESL